MFHLINAFSDWHILHLSCKVIWIFILTLFCVYVWMGLSVWQIYKCMFCVHVYTCDRTHVRERTHVCGDRKCAWTHVCGDRKVYIKYVFFVHLCFETEFLTEPGTHQVARQVDQRLRQLRVCAPVPALGWQTRTTMASSYMGAADLGCFSCLGFAGPKLHDLSKKLYLLRSITIYSSYWIILYTELFF